MAQQILSTNTFTTAKWIVSATASDGTHTTIAAALTSAASGDTIFIRPGTYTENPTLKAGVNLTAFGSDGSLNGTGKVIISGTCTMTTAGNVTIYGIQLQTNSAALLAVTGSAASIVELVECYLNCTNNTGITFSSSSGSALINLNECKGNLGTTGIALFAHSSAGNIYFNDCTFSNGGVSTTASTCSSGNVFLRYSIFSNPMTFSSTGILQGQWSGIDTSAQNVIALTMGGTSGLCFFCNFSSGSASAITISTTLTLQSSMITSSNTNAITGAGAILYSGLLFQGSSTTINTTTQTTSGTLQGSKNTAPTAGMLGEQIRASVVTASAITLTTTTYANVTSMSLTPGIWDVSAIGSFQGAAGTAFSVSISTVSVTPGIPGDSQVATSGSPVVGVVDNAISIPSYRITLSATTTVYLVVIAVFGAGTMKACGRISGTRVG